MTDVVMMAQVSYVNRSKDNQYSTHWQIIKPNADLELGNDEGDGVWLSISLWERVRTAPLPAQYHWATETEAADYMSKYCKRIAN